MIRPTLAAFLLSAASILPAQRAATPPADLIVTTARVYTVDDARPLASAIAVRDGRIQFVGSAAEALALRGANTRLVDAAGRTIVPGIVDAHAHLLGLGYSLANVQRAIGAGARCSRKLA